MKKKLGSMLIMSFVLFLSMGFSANADYVKKTAYDESFSVKSEVTLYYDTVWYDKYGVEYVKITKVVGKITRLQSNVQLLNTQVGVSQVGMGYNNVPYMNQYKFYNVPVGQTYTIVPPTTWKPVGVEYFAKIKAQPSMTIKRGTKTWSLTHVNALLP